MNFFYYLYKNFIIFITSETTWTALGAIISGSVLWQSIKQIKKQDRRQNILDSRQKIIDQKERRTKEINQVTRIFTDHEFTTSSKTAPDRVEVSLTLYNRSEFPIYSVFVIGRWAIPSPEKNPELSDPDFIAYLGNQITPGNLNLTIYPPGTEAGSPWPLVITIILEDNNGITWKKTLNSLTKLKTPFTDNLSNQFGINNNFLAGCYWLFDNEENTPSFHYGLLKKEQV